MKLIDADKAIGRYYAEWEKQDISELSNEKGIFAALSSSLFPSLELYASIALDEIIGGRE